MTNKFHVKSKVWVFSGDSSWHFLTVPTDTTKKIDKLFSGLKAGFGSLPVEVSLGKSTWQTSIFPDSKAKTYLLPLKAKIRKVEKISEGDDVQFSLSIRV
jgi:Domain of unknown function (DUF1905)